MTCCSIKHVCRLLHWGKGTQKRCSRHNGRRLTYGDDWPKVLGNLSHHHKWLRVRANLLLICCQPLSNVHMLGYKNDTLHQLSTVAAMTPKNLNIYNKEKSISGKRKLRTYYCFLSTFMLPSASSCTGCLLLITTPVIRKNQHPSSLSWSARHSDTKLLCLKGGTITARYSSLLFYVQKLWRHSTKLENHWL